MHVYCIYPWLELKPLCNPDRLPPPHYIPDTAESFTSSIPALVKNQECTDRVFLWSRHLRSVDKRLYSRDTWWRLFTVMLSVWEVVGTTVKVFRDKHAGVQVSNTLYLVCQEVWRCPGLTAYPISRTSTWYSLTGAFLTRLETTAPG